LTRKTGVSLIASVALVLASTTGCGQARTSTSAATVTTDGRARASTPAATVTTGTMRSHAVGSDALSSPIKFGEGALTLAPPSPTAVPVTSAETALSTVQASSSYEQTFAALPSTGIEYALFTDPGDGPQPSVGQTFKPTYSSYPVWFIEYKNVSVAAEHGISAATTVPSATPTTEDGSVLADEYFIVDDSKDTLIMVVTDSLNEAPPTTEVRAAAAG
jgi:hypothetical protein